MNISVEKQSKNPQALPEVVSLTWIDVLFGVVLLAAAVLRLLDLGVVPLNSAEAQQALSVWQFGQPGRAVGEIVSPAYFTFTSLVHPFFGDHDWVMRLVPALFGASTSVPLAQRPRPCCWPFRR